MRSINDYLLNKHTPNGRTFPNLKGFMKERDSGRFVETKEPENGDIIAFFSNARLYHVGIYINGRILHTSQAKNCRYERLERTGLHTIRFYHYVRN